MRTTALFGAISVLLAVGYLAALGGPPSVLATWVVPGLIVGTFAAAVAPRRHGVAGDLLIGTSGAIIGGIIVSRLRTSGATFSFMGTVFAGIAALMVLAATRLVIRAGPEN